MRPVPPKKHHWAALVLLAVVAANAAVTWRQADLSGGQCNMLAEAYKHAHADAYPTDTLFGPAQNAGHWRLHLPAWQGILSAFIHLAGGDLAMAMWLLAGAMLLVYLFAMYLLLYRRTHSTSAACMIAIMSTALFSHRSEFWGLGPIFSVRPETFCLIFMPLLAMGFLRYRRRPGVLLIFLAAGVIGNIDLVTAAQITVMMLTATLALGKFRGQAWLLAGAGILAVVAGSSPAIMHILRARQGWAPVENLQEVLALGGQTVLYPGVLLEVLRALPLMALLALPAGVILAKARMRVRGLQTWLWMLSGAFVAGLGLQGLAQFIGWLMGTGPVTLGAIGGVRLAFLPLYVLLAHGLVHLFRMVQRHRSWLRAVLALMVLAVLGSSYNTKPLRDRLWGMLNESAATEKAADATATAREGFWSGTGDPEKDELVAISSWLAANTPADTLVLSDEPLLRPLAKRSLLVTTADLPYFYYLAPAKVPGWLELVKTQRRLLEPPASAQADPRQIAAFVDDLWSRRGEVYPPTYVVIPARSAPAGAGRLTLVPSPSASSGQATAWGVSYRLFQVQPPG